MGAAFLRRMDWLGAVRARGYLKLLALLNIVTLAVLLVTSKNGVDRNGFLLGSDFISFWTSGRMLVAGADVYDTAAHIGWQRAYFASSTGYTAFFYPPLFLPLCWPLGFLGYFPALAAWLLATGAVYMTAVRRWLGDSGVPAPLWLLLLAFPAVLIVVTHGQTAFLVAGLLGLGLWLVPVRPLLAGVLLGLAAIKPQFGPLVALVLLLTGEWKAIFAAIATILVLAGLSTLFFGAGVWPEWLAAGGRARLAMEAGVVPFGKMTSVFAALRLLGMPVMAAYILYGVVAGIVVALAIRCSWKRSFTPALAAVALAGAPLLTPFALDYDMVLLAFPLAWLAGQGLATGWRDWEKLAVLLAFVAPAFARSLALNFGLPIMPLVLMLLFVVLVRRATGELPVHSIDTHQ